LTGVRLLSAEVGVVSELLVGPDTGVVAELPDVGVVAGTLAGLDRGVVEAEPLPLLPHDVMASKQIDTAAANDL
jgi:hypothetical protein